jgi:hypothetical protein
MSPPRTTLTPVHRRESIIEREFNHLLAHFAPKSSRSSNYGSLAEEETKYPKHARELKEKL